MDRYPLDESYKNLSVRLSDEKNNDYSGIRDMNGNQENVVFRHNSFVRTWFNDLTVGYDTHWHSALEIILPLECDYDVTIQDENFIVKPGEILLVPPRALHSIKAPISGTRLIFMFELEGLKNLQNFSGISSLISKPIFVTPSSPSYNQFYEILTKIQEEYFSNHEYSELSIYAQLIQLMVTIGYDHISQPDMFPNVREQKQKEYVHKFNQLIAYIDEHLSENIDPETIAESAGFSKYHFLRLFKQYTGDTFADYVNIRRLKKSEELLENSDLSIADISANAGFSSISTFNRIFKQYKGCSPTEYRTHHNRNPRA